MVALQIRDVPDDVRRVLSAQAAASGQSLQAYLLSLVTREADRARNLALIDDFVEERDGSSVTADDVVGALDRARQERTHTLTLRTDGASE